MVHKITNKIRLYFLGIDWIIYACVVIIFAINIIIQSSANDNMNRIIVNIAYIILSLIIMTLVANFNCKNLRYFVVAFYCLSIILLIGVLFFGISVNGAKRWLDFGLFRLQPSELCKLSTPMIASYIIAYLFNQSNANLAINKLGFKSMIISLLAIILPVILIAKQPDLGTAILVFIAGFFVLFFFGLNWLIVIAIFILLAISAPVIWYSLLHDYQKHRIITMLNPDSDPLGKGYHINQGKIAIGSGGLFGKGYLKGTQSHLDFIPEKHTDFVGSVIAEEFGFLGVLTILILYACIILRGIWIMTNTEDGFLRAIAGSISASFALYIVVNLGMISGMLPVVGVPLPLISYGGTSTIMLIISIGILLSIAKSNHFAYRNYR